MSTDDFWPALRVSDWDPTRETLHMWTQIVGKIRMTESPLINHWWEVTLYVSPRGLTTSSIPYGNRMFDLEFDFIDHVLAIHTSDGGSRTVALAPKSVADFYAETFAALRQLGIETRIHAQPNEVDPAIPFAEDHQHASYDPEAAHLFWRQLVQAHRVISDFRAYFIGKVSPVHFFWGSFDLACSRFSGRTAPRYSGTPLNCPDWVMVEGYSHQLSSCGFWPGGADEGAFYSYAYPAPDRFADSRIGPDAAFYSQEFMQFLLPYEAVRTSADPDRTLMEFLQSTYAAAADLADWDRASLETDPNRLSKQRG